MKIQWKLIGTDLNGTMGFSLTGFLQVVLAPVVMSTTSAKCKLSLRYLFMLFPFFPLHQYQLHLPTMDQPRTQFRRKAYNELSRLLAKLDPPSPISLSQDELQLLGIECTVMALHPQGHRDAHPLFCKLVPSKIIDRAFVRTFVDEDTIPPWPEYIPTFSSRFYPALSIGLTLLDYTMSGQEIREPLVPQKWYATGLVLAFVLSNETMTYRTHRDSTSALTLHQHHYPDTRSPWGVCKILRVDDISKPHLACLLMDDAPADEDLRPTELISAVRLMKQAIRLDKLNQFRVNPVRVCFSVPAINCSSDTDMIFFFTGLCLLLLLLPSSNPGNLLRSRHVLRQEDTLH